jgi:nucleoside-diphosphate-sugar epimerase
MNILILGGTGGSGRACALEFLRQGHKVVILGREQGKLDALVAQWGNPGALSTVTGDVYRSESLIPSFTAADVVIQAANPGYLGITDHLPRLIESVLEAAELTGKRVVFLEGVYTYGKNPGAPVREDSPAHPVSRKGAVKQACAERILDPQWKRLQTMIVRLPDYYGPTSQMAYLDGTLKAMVGGKFGFFLGGRRPKREYIFLPDAAERIVRLASDPAAYGQIWNLSGVQLSGKMIVKTCRKHLRHTSLVWFLGPWSIHFLGLFDPFFRELSEMTYLLEDPLILDGNKYAAAYGPPKNTDPRIGLGLTLDALKEPRSL